MSTTVDLAGQVFTRWTAISCNSAQTCSPTNRRWLCRCECGTIREVKAKNLLYKLSRSCGCLHNEQFLARVVTHGMYDTPEYIAWQNMKKRCLIPSHPSFHHYGGRGITVCDRWIDSFKNFYADMGPRPEGKTLERCNNSEGYSPENCCWDTRKRQARNTRSTKYVQYLGQEVSLSEAAELSGINKGTLRHRMRKGWPAQDLFLPVKGSA
jgi:hypothetical protein